MSKWQLRDAWHNFLNQQLQFRGPYTKARKMYDARVAWQQLELEEKLTWLPK